MSGFDFYLNGVKTAWFADEEDAREWANQFGMSVKTEIRVAGQPKSKPVPPPLPEEPAAFEATRT